MSHDMQDNQLAATSQNTITTKPFRQHIFEALQTYSTTRPLENMPTDLSEPTEPSGVATMTTWRKDVVEGVLKKLSISKKNACQGVILTDENLSAFDTITKELYKSVKGMPESVDRPFDEVYILDIRSLTVTLFGAAIESWAQHEVAQGQECAIESPIDLPTFTRAIYATCSGLAQCLRMAAREATHKPMALVADLSSVQSTSTFKKLIEAELSKYPRYDAFYNTHRD
ncbi:hypothetical protein EV182_003153, partial [Spiromyces aspiralis]